MNQDNFTNKIKLKLNKKNLAILIGILVFIVLCLVLCFKVIFKGDSKDTKKEETPSVPILTDNNIKIIDPTSTSRPIAVMINNDPTVIKYHRGLQDAYIVYEMIVEGGISRMMALYKDVDLNDELIGSIRSSRHYYLDYAMENDAIYIHCGMSPYAEEDMKKYGVNHINIDSSKDITSSGVNIGRDLNIKVANWNNLYARWNGISEKVNKSGYRTTIDTSIGLLLNYKAKEVDLSSKSDAIVANNISIKYGSTTTQYAYDSQNKVYLRSVNDKQHVDYDTKKQYTVKNIITYQVDNNTIAGGGKGRQELDNLGSGTGYYITDGYAVAIKWSKATRQSQTKYTYLDGTEIEVNDGNTFIQIQPKGQSLIIE